MNFQAKLDKLTAIEIEIKLLTDFLSSKESGVRSPAVTAHLYNRVQQLERRKQTLLTPKPRTPKAAATASPVDLPMGAYKNSRERRGRNGR